MLMMVDMAIYSCSVNWMEVWNDCIENICSHHFLRRRNLRRCNLSWHDIWWTANRSHMMMSIKHFFHLPASTFHH